GQAVRPALGLTVLVLRQPPATLAYIKEALALATRRTPVGVHRTARRPPPSSAARPISDRRVRHGLQRLLHDVPAGAVMLRPRRGRSARIGLLTAKRPEMPKALRDLLEAPRRARVSRLHQPSLSPSIPTGGARRRGSTPSAT